MVLAMNVPQDLITLSDAAREYGKEKLGVLGVRYGTLRGWVVRGELRSWRQGERILVSRAEVEALIQPKPNTTQGDTSSEG